MKINDFLAAVVRDQDGRIVDVDEARPGAKAHVASDSRDESQVDSLTRGAPPQGREGELEVCQRLARCLFGPEEDWTVEERAEADDVDYSIFLNGSLALEVQVTQALSSRERWSELAQQGALEEVATYEEIAAALLRSVESKRDLYSAEQRARLTLILDAIRTPAAVLASVVAAARRLDGFSKAGFESVWVVGPLERTVFHLDREEGLDAAE